MSPSIWGFPSVDCVCLLFSHFVKIPRPSPWVQGWTLPSLCKRSWKTASDKCTPAATAGANPWNPPTPPMAPGAWPETFAAYQEREERLLEQKFPVYPPCSAKAGGKTSEEMLLHPSHPIPFHAIPVCLPLPSQHAEPSSWHPSMGNAGSLG